MNLSRHLFSEVRVLAAAVTFAAPLALSPAAAQESVQASVPELRGSVEQDILKSRADELEKARAAQQRAAAAEKKLKAEIEALGADRRKLAAALIETAAKLRETESRLSATEGRIEPLEHDERALRQSLADRHEEIAQVLAALQRAGRRPPPALLVSPEDALKSVRSAIMLGAVVPQMRERTERLAADLNDLVRLRTQIAAERARLTTELATLGTEQQRMSALVEERQKSQVLAEQSLASERQAAIDMASRIDNLKELVTRLEHGLESANRAARAAERASAQDPQDQKGENRADFLALRDPGRLSPAIAFASARGMLPLPVNGVRIRNFGAADRLGGTDRGISIATRAGAQVTAPSDAWVVYAGPFRSYGQLLILNAGGGYHILLAGMERISVEIGQFVLTGEPVAVMGSGASRIASAAPVGTSQPVLYIEFRKDGTPVDPSPWWAKSENEKVRG